MKIIVLGATGGTGMEIARQGIERGYSITAFVRSPERLEPFQERITVRQGDLLDRSDLEGALRGHDAVLSGFGPRLPISESDADLLQRFAIVLTGAMGGAGVKRVVVISTAFLFRDSVLPPAYLFGRLFFPGIVRDAAAMEDVLEKSGLDWTIVRPPQLKDKPLSGKYRVRVGHLPRFGFSIACADVADYMIKAAENPSLIGKVVGISN
ncbi:MAG TPA: SDR family oxidoreductase [Terriglobia bacterium]|nr:SDR family oxidoreductase [Terriglobia bacterium]